jgi:hypothetical protein
MRNRARESGNYDVGYKRPPKEHQFAKGKSGNPRGRRRLDPPVYRPLMELIIDHLEKPITVKEGRKKRLMATGEAIAAKFVRRALEGDPAAFKLLLTISKNFPEPPDSDVMIYREKRTPEKDAAVQRFLNSDPTISRDRS